MKTDIRLYSTKSGEIERFLSSFYNKNLEITNELKHTVDFENPIEMTELIGTFVENNDNYNINMWISLDKGIYINITPYNADKIIRYIYERFPY